jgi:hypothetical protein
MSRTRPGLKKLDDWSHKIIFVRYESGSKAYMCFDLVEQHVIMSCDVIFDEVGMWRWQANDKEAANDTEPFTVEYITEVVQALVHQAASPPQPTASTMR